MHWAAAESQRADVDYRPVQMDLSQPGAAEEIIQWLDREDIELDVLVNNVGFGMMGEHVEQDSQKLERMLTLNNILLSKLCMLVGATMKARGEGKIMNIGSLAGFCPMPFFAAYSASKAFVINLSASLQEELKPTACRSPASAPALPKRRFWIPPKANTNPPVASEILSPHKSPPRKTWLKRVTPP